MMNYLNYFIKCIIRNITRLICKPKVLLTILIIIFILILIGNSCFAIYEGDNTYSDPNNTIKIAYDSIVSDFVTRLSTTSSNTTSIINLLKNPQYNYYIWYGANTNGENMMNSSTWKTDTMNIIFYSTDFSPSFTNKYNNYQGITCDILELTQYSNFYRFTSNNNLSDLTRLEYSVDLFIPSTLIAYRSNILTDFLTNSSQQQTDSVIQAIEESSAQTQNTIKESTEEMTNTITSTDYDEDTISFNTSSSDDVSDTEVTGLFTTIFNNFSNLLNSSNWDTPSTIEVPLPHTDEKIVLTSDILSKIVGSGVIRNLINTAWYFLFGVYVFKFVNNIIHSIKSGDILGGLSLNDEVITSSML